MNKDVIRQTRQFLNGVHPWITQADYARSINHYGCPPDRLPLLEQPIDDTPTYTDLLVYAAGRLGAPIYYLELGVSVGKNFYTLANLLPDAELYGFDCEPINPTLARRLLPLADDGPLQRFRLHGNRINYLRGDIATPADWQPLARKRFNLIFSDAAHHADAILAEADLLERLHLIDRRGFVVVWDDLDRSPTGPLTQAFTRIADRWREMYQLQAGAAFQVPLNGWLGQHEHVHTIGVINNIGLTQAGLASVGRVPSAAPSTEIRTPTD